MNSHAKLDSLVGLDPSDEAFLLSPIGKDARGEQGTRHPYPSIGLYERRLGPRACEPGKTRCSATRRLARKWIPLPSRSGPSSGFHFFHMMNTEGPTRRRQDWGGNSGGCRNASLADWMTDNLTWRAQPLCATDRSFRGCICG